MLVVAYTIYKINPFSFSVERTFWCRRITSITLWRSTGKYSSKRVFAIPFGNDEKWEAWDSEMHKTGEYKKYRKEDGSRKR